MSLRCKIGIHDWDGTPAYYITALDEKLAIPSMPATRKCQRCKKAQWRDEFCLGFNPPEYVYTWYPFGQGHKLLFPISKTGETK